MRWAGFVACALCSLDSVIAAADFAQTGRPNASIISVGCAVVWAIYAVAFAARGVRS